MIFKLAGTSGSGKSSFVRAAFKLWKFAPVLWSPDKPKIKEYVAQVKLGEPLAGLYKRVWTA
jgi:ABC-type dipeptide/oligopeptide/nickel transport system ATPase component